ncbi:hypothetical protein [Clostridium felsineum]|nr:hypothetical protein [Clostridium felsineum]URZ16901.1 hypothetical protein CLFE_029480 [Clostridium felsineum DSM 794]
MWVAHFAGERASSKGERLLCDIVYVVAMIGAPVCALFFIH